MHYAYKAADMVVSRAGAIALAEICAVGKASILVPYPHAAEDHQTVNASVLVNSGAAIMVADKEANEKLVDEIILMAGDMEKRNAFGKAAHQLYVQDADKVIAQKIIDTLEKK
jgi:UDP-N-acetylglucosamine--N-acetylmuramyl-(pentapeptide) pyrophosphoryl-undecaprenol N-acetylglucosamine transferase